MRLGKRKSPLPSLQHSIFSASLTKFKSQYQKYLWDLNAKDRVNGRTVLWIAAQKSKTPLVRFLLAKKVDVNLADKNGITPLAKSIMVNNIRTATMLLSHGANPNLGQTDNMLYVLSFARFVNLLQF